MARNREKAKRKKEGKDKEINP